MVTVLLHMVGVSVLLVFAAGAFLVGAIADSSGLRIGGLVIVAGAAIWLAAVLGWQALRVARLIRYN